MAANGWIRGIKNVNIETAFRHSLPSSVRNAPSLTTFRRELKTVLFRTSFHNDQAIVIVLQNITVVCSRLLTVCSSVLFTHHPLVRAKGKVFVLLYVFFVFLFGQQFLDNPQADSRQSLHAGVLWFRMCLLPFWGLVASGGRKKGAMKFSLLQESVKVLDAHQYFRCLI